MIYIILAILYLVLHRVLGSILKFTYNAIKSQLVKTPRNVIRKQTPKETLKQKVSKAWKYCIREDLYKSGLIVLGLYLLGLVFCLLFWLFGLWYVSIGLLLFPYIVDLVAFEITKKVLLERSKIIEKMMILKQAKMGFANKENPITDNEIQILEWGDDKIFPQKLRIFLPVLFDPIQSENFLLQWNIVFGEGKSYAPDIEDKEFAGWQYTKGVVTLKALDPLPNKAMWDVSYLDPSQCAWSFFPLAIGNAGGTMMKHPETGKMVHVLGIDLAGQQQKLAKKNGLWCSSEIKTSPQTLIVGATGGGKSLHINTKLFIKENNQ